MNIPYLEPVEKPRGLYLKIAYRFLKSLYGRVIMPAKVIYARKPQLLKVASLLNRIETKKLKLEPSLSIAIKALVASVNDCSFCKDLALAEFLKKQMGRERFKDLTDFENSDEYTGAEKAALRFARQVVVLNGVEQQMVTELKNHYTETEIIEIAWLCSAETYYNMLSKAFGIGSDSLAQTYDNAS